MGWHLAARHLIVCATDPNPNPPSGTGTQAVGSLNGNYALHNGTAIDNAGIADAGTRLEVTINYNGVSGPTVLVPEAVYLTNGTTTGGVLNHSGVAVLVTTNADGSGALFALSAAV